MNEIEEAIEWRLRVSKKFGWVFKGAKELASHEWKPSKGELDWNGFRYYECTRCGIMVAIKKGEGCFNITNQINLKWSNLDYTLDGTCKEIRMLVALL